MFPGNNSGSLRSDRQTEHLSLSSAEADCWIFGGKERDVTDARRQLHGNIAGDGSRGHTNGAGARGRLKSGASKQITFVHPPQLTVAMPSTSWGGNRHNLALVFIMIPSPEDQSLLGLMVSW